MPAQQQPTDGRRQQHQRAPTDRFDVLVQRLFRALATEADARRTELLNAEGWTVIRFGNASVLTDIDNVLREIAAHLPPEYPPPPACGRGRLAR